MSISDELVALRGRLDELERGAGCVGDWHRLAARAARAIIVGHTQLACCAHAAALRAQLEELQVLRLCVQSRVCELEAVTLGR